MYMFALNENGTLSQQAKMKLYYCKIWDTTGTLVRDFIPVLKTGVYCLYDRVSQTYFNNKGTGTFTGA
jgi:hypothetical protein